MALLDASCAVTALEAAVDGLASVDVGSSGGTELRHQLAALKRASSKLEAHIGRLTHAADAAGAWIGTGARDTAEWLANETGTSSRRNRTAAELGHAMERSDELAAAVTSGDLSTDKANAVVGAAGDLAVDDDLLDRVADLPLNSVKPAVESWRAEQDPDRDVDIAASQRARRYLRLTGQPDGMTRVDGLLDPESGAIVRATLDGVMNLTAFDGTVRTRDQRCADALTQLCVAESKGEITGGRSNTKLLATVPVDTIVNGGSGRGRTHVGTTLDAATVRQLACDAGIHRVITGPASSVLDFGHETRLVSDNLFHALVTRDQHCRWPGCTVRATWCDAHHIVEWSHGGPTNQDNCALLCHRHHQLSHEPGYALTGTGTHMEIRHPDGTIRSSRPPGATPPRADNVGREPRPGYAPPPTEPDHLDAPFTHLVQLALV